MKVLFDTNIILDVLLDREPHVHASLYLMSRAERGDITAFACATTITTIHYLTAKALGVEAASCHIASLLALFTIAPVNRLTLDGALHSEFTDFEDAVLHEAAIHAGAQYIVTRNIRDFQQAKIPVYEPKTLIGIINTLSDEH